MPDAFCGHCGQERKTLRVAFHRIVGEAVAETLTLDSRAARTLGALLFRPGKASADYLAGRRASQTSPVKLYLFLSFLYFLAAAVSPGSSVGVQVSTRSEAESQEARASAEELRELGPAGALLADRLERLESVPRDRLQATLSASFAENAPKAMFFLVPVLALLLRLACLRSGFFFAEHVVVALHMHAVAFLLLIPGQLSGRQAVTMAGLLAAGAHAAAAMHRVYGWSWAGTLARAAGVGFLYLVALGLALAAIVFVALLDV